MIINVEEFQHQKNLLSTKKVKLINRTKIINSMRIFLDSQGFLEVSTPIRIKSPAPELNIDPIPTGEKFLIASPELQMKRLVAAGYDKIFQITKCFRANEHGKHHASEFTMLEWYRKDGKLDDLANDCKNFIIEGAKAISNFPEISYNNKKIKLNNNWPIIELVDAFEKYAGWIPVGDFSEEKFELDLVDKVEPNLNIDTPVFLTGYPASMASLAKIDPKNVQRALRMELYAGGLELANGFEELTDWKIQQERFEKEESMRQKQNKPSFQIDESFIGALKVGLPPTAGMAMGIDRLVMLLTDSQSIEDVVTFIERDTF